jgi:phospholipid/cholesterol/gamma-HCH transport system substrate-binding protein
MEPYCRAERRVMRKDLLETLVGVIVVLVAVLFVYYAYGTTKSLDKAEGYVLHAKFNRIDGLRIGSDVRVAGIKVGAVIGNDLDPQTYQAILAMRVRNDIKLPIDSAAEIVGNGLLGDKYVALAPGADEEMLKENDFISFTQSSISLESLIGKFMFGVDKPDNKESVATKK